MTEQRVVEDDVRRERAVVDDSQVRDHVRTRGDIDTADARVAADRTENAAERGARRAANKLDDLKDRVDGNPASRPGPDATDRRI